ncbi:MAG: glycosyltransferase [Chloracidobacterium sp.]|nr:glycosyltransferase [Chloracidobacterium sp.]
MSSAPISVGVPVYNGEATIRTVISSLLAQTYAHIEIVISDNCSNDRTREICLEYAAQTHE